MYGDGAMFLGNSKDTNEQHSLIGTTIRTFVSIIAASNLLTVLANNETVLATEINFLSTLGEAVALANNDTVLTTEILTKTLAATNVFRILAARIFLILSITDSLDDPAIKDITSSLSIIDTTDTYVEPRVETEVI